MSSKANRKRTVGVRDLKTHAAGIVQRVREARASYIITHRGEPVGMILPLDPVEGGHEDVDADQDPWQTFLDAGRRLERRFQPGVSGVELLSGMRR